MTSLFGRLLRNVSFNVLLQAWLALVSLVATPILYSRLGSDAYGLFAVANLVISQLAVLEFGFGHATTRFLAAAVGRRDRAGERRVVATSLVVFLTAGCVGALSVLAASRFLIESYFQVPEALRHSGQRVLALSALLFLLSMLTNLLGAVWRGLQRFGTLNLVRGLSGSLQSVGALIVVVLGGGVEDVVAWTAWVSVAALLASALLLRRSAPELLSWPRPSLATLREMAGFGGLLMLAGILTQLYLTGGTLVLARFVAVGALPFYAIPLSLFQRLLSVASGVAAVLLPMVAGLVEAGAAALLEELPGRGLRLLLLATLPLAVSGSLLSQPLLTLWMGGAFAEQASWPVQCCLFAFLLATVTVPWTELARGRGRGWPLVAYTAVLAAANVGATLLLAPRWGVPGAATALLAAQATGTLWLIASSGHAGRALRTSARILLIGLAYGLASYAAGQATADWAARLGAAALLTLAYAWAAWSVGLDYRERQVMRRAVGLSQV